MVSERKPAPRFKIEQMIGYFPNREEYLWAEGIALSRGSLTCRSRSAIEPLTNVFVMLSLLPGGPAQTGQTDGSPRRVRCEGYVSSSRAEEDGSCLFEIHFEGIQPEDKPYFDAYLRAAEEGSPEQKQQEHL